MPQPTERGEAIEPPHRQVEENEIRGEPATGCHRLVTTGRDAGNLEVGLPRERLGETFEKHGMVIDQEESQRVHGWNGAIIISGWTESCWS